MRRNGRPPPVTSFEPACSVQYSLEWREKTRLGQSISPACRGLAACTRRVVEIDHSQAYPMRERLQRDWIKLGPQRNSQPPVIEQPVHGPLARIEPTAQSKTIVPGNHAGAQGVAHHECSAIRSQRRSPAHRDVPHARHQHTKAR